MGRSVARWVHYYGKRGHDSPRPRIQHDIGARQPARWGQAHAAVSIWFLSSQNYQVTQGITES